MKLGAKNFYRLVFHRKKGVWKTDLVIVAVFLAIVFVFVVWQPSLPSKQEIENWVASFGIYGPLAIISSVIIETVVAPIPGTFISIATGALYNIWPGILYLWIGNIIGSSLAFFVAQKFGRRLVKRIISEDKIRQYDKFLGRNRLLILLVYMAPIFPIDIFGYIIGISSLRYRQFLPMISFGFAVNLFILTLIGDKLITVSGSAKLVYVGAIILIILAAMTVEKIYFRRDK